MAQTNQIIVGSLNIETEWAIVPYVFYTEVSQTRVVDRSDPKAHWRFPQGERMPPQAEKALQEYEANGRRYLPDPRDTPVAGEEVASVKTIERPPSNKMVSNTSNK